MSGESRMSHVLSEMKDQWRSMTGMAAMFVVTIALAIYIQPFWDRPESRAFGEAGTTKVGLIGLEFILIIIFTAIIIWLAKRGLQVIIKWGVLFILWISLSYAMIPLASYAMDVPQPEIEFRDENPLDGEILFTDVDANSFMMASDTFLTRMENPSGLDAGEDPTEIWSMSLDLGNETYSAHPKTVVDNGDHYVMCDRVRWLKLAKDTGEVEGSYEEQCTVGFFDGENDWGLVDQFMYKLDPFHSNQPIHTWWYRLPPQFLASQFQRGVMLESSQILLVTDTWAGVIEIPQEQHNQEFGEVNATVVWEAYPDSSDSFTATAWGHSPWSGYRWWDAESTDRLLMLGSESGQIYAYVWDGESMVAEEHIKFNERDAFDSEIQGIMLADDQKDGRTDVWIASQGSIRMFSGWVMVESAELTGLPTEGSINMLLHTVDAPDWDEIDIEDGILTAYGSESAQSAVIATPVNSPAFILQDEAGYWLPIYWSQIIALVASTILMVALTIRPEWYIVNTTGILTGAGVITIIGVSFVPPLILIFMVITAIYDAYAVYKSKHMLDLADTMIGLKLPILLVAPQDKDYSFLDEGNDTMTRSELPPQSEMRPPRDGDVPPPPVKRPKKSGGDALFMGLGDIIFPGMLVVSALTFLPSGGEIMGISEPLFVAIGTLIGGLIGYFILMSYVAMGRPQAGLPLLNGGSILGYLITGFLAVGMGAISFGITIF
ncbi:MAG: hypothetical protein H8D82_01085 [Euryarchaeota archaeon]|nr:hypothetical protein [Euryarchaeota archaeon]